MVSGGGHAPSYSIAAAAAPERINPIGRSASSVRCPIKPAVRHNRPSHSFGTSCSAITSFQETLPSTRTEHRHFWLAETSSNVTLHVAHFL